MENHLAPLIETKREEVAQRFADHLLRTAAAASMQREDIIDSLREFLLELAVGIRADELVPEPESTATPSRTAGMHGVQRLGLGYDVGAVVREYGVLHDILFQIIEESGVSFSTRQLRLLTRRLVSGIADAAARYGQERDAQLRDQTARHVAFLAHELRNPLGSVRLVLHRLWPVLRQADARSAAIAERGLGKLGTLIDEALVEVKLRAGIKANQQPVPLDELLQELVADSLGDAEARGVAIELECAAEAVVADRKLLHSALSNLLRNAVKFSHGNGTVTLRARVAEHRAIFEVEDSCGGLPEGAVQKLFDPFVQVGKDRSGFGLGLAIAKQAAEAHTGDLRVHDLPGRGCVFVLDLPQPS